jgi:hypothetical protein
MKFSYMASPYTSPAGEVRMQRRELADVFAARLAYLYAVFSPITHGTRLEPHLPMSKVKSHRFWMDQCIPVLRKADILHVLPIDGWRQSEGVRIEVDLAVQLRMPIRIMQAHDHFLEIISPEEFKAMGWVPEWLEAPKARGGRSHASYQGDN